MKFQVGDMVMSLLDDYPGLEYGEFGTIIELREGNTPVIEWDEFNPERHDCDGRVRKGHGWFVYDNSQIELNRQCVDLGHFCETHLDLDNFLFDI